MYYFSCMFTEVYDFLLLICIVFVLWELFLIKKTNLFTVIYPLSADFAKPVDKFRYVLLAKE